MNKQKHSYNRGYVVLIAAIAAFGGLLFGLGMSIATMVNWLSNFLIANTFLSLGRATTGVMPIPRIQGHWSTREVHFLSTQ